MSERFVPTDEDGGLILATVLPGSEHELGDQRLSWNELRAQGDDRVLWVHLDRTRERAQQWLRTEASLEPFVVDALLAEETRPTFQMIGDGLLVILRGVNMHPGAEPDEFIALRMWFDRTRVITLRHYRFQTIVELRQRAQRQSAPATPGAFLAAVAHGLATRMGPSVQNLQDMLDEVEDAMIAETGDGRESRRSLSDIRRQAISIRRYVVPQRDALRELTSQQIALLTSPDVTLLRLAAEQVARVADALEELRDRAAVNQDEIRARHEARVGRTVYLLTLVAALALPLSLLTGLLGINVGGIPLADSAYGFTIICVIMVVIAVVEIVVLRRLRWL